MRKLLVLSTMILVLCAAALPATAATFSGYATDMDRHWAKEYVWYLQRNGLLDGYPDGTFRPDQPVTRAEFTKMFMRVARNEYCNVHQIETVVKPDFQISRFNDYKQIPGWAAADIEYAVKYGYITGFPDNTFRPNATITKVQAITIIGRTLDREYDIQSLKFVDPIPDWARPAVAKAYDYGIVESKKDGLFNGDTIMTRADIAKFLYIYYVGEDIE